MRVVDTITLGGYFLAFLWLVDASQSESSAFVAAVDHGQQESIGSNSTMERSGSDSQSAKSRDQLQWQEQQQQYHEVSLYVILPVMLSILGTTGVIVFCTFRRVHRPVTAAELASAAQARRISALELLHAFRPIEAIHKEGMPVRMVETRQLLIEAFEKMPFMYVYDRQMDSMLGRDFIVQEVLLNGMVGLPSPDGSQGGIWFFPPQAVVPVRHSLNIFAYCMPSKTEAAEDRFEPMCTICLLDFEPGERVAKLPCLHLFHAECIQGWLAQHWQCPYRCPGVVHVPIEETQSHDRSASSPRGGVGGGGGGLGLALSSNSYASPWSLEQGLAVVLGRRGLGGPGASEEDLMEAWDLPGAIQREQPTVE